MKKQAQVNLKLSAIEVNTVFYIVRQCLNAAKYEKSDKCYYDNGDVIFRLDSKEKKALETFLKKI